MLLCSHPLLTQRRRKFVQILRAFASTTQVQQLTTQIAMPDFDDPSVIFTITQLCTGVGSNFGAFGLQQQPIPPILARAVDRQRAPQFIRDSGAARGTIAWMSPLFDDWLHVSRNPRCDDLPHHSAGFKLAEIVARHIKAMFDLRKTALALSSAIASSFLRRARDPGGIGGINAAPNRPVSNTIGHGTAPAQFEDHDADDLATTSSPVRPSICTRITTSYRGFNQACVVT